MERVRQALDASRTPAFTFEPHTLILVTTPGERFYSPTIEDPVPDCDILDAAARGIKLSLLVRRTADGDAVVAGRQRTKRALVVNHLLGVKAYDGPIKSVREAIKRIKGTDLETRIIELAGARFPKGLMLKAFAENGGTDLDAEAAGIAEDEIRRGGSGTSIQIRAARARQLHEAGYPVEKIAETMQDVSVATVKRWVKRDPGATSKPGGKRGKAIRPGAARLVRLADAAQKLDHAGGLPVGVARALAFAAGKMTEEEFLGHYPKLAATAEKNAEAE